jgi:hypothetical protein
MAVLKQSAAKGETTKTTITGPPSIEEFREQTRRKRKPSGDTNMRTKKQATSATVNGPQLRSKDELRTRKFFAPLRSTEMEADHGEDADDSTEGQEQQASPSQAGRPPPTAPTCQVNLIQLQGKLLGLLKVNIE